jgi:hypothetical protein
MQMHDVAAASRSRRRAPHDVPLCSRHLSSNVQLFPYQLFNIQHYSHHFEANIKHLEMLRRRAAAEAVGFGTRSYFEPIPLVLCALRNPVVVE